MKAPTEEEILTKVREIEDLVNAGNSVSLSQHITFKGCDARLRFHVLRNSEYIKILNAYMEKIGLPTKYFVVDGSIVRGKSGVLPQQEENRPGDFGDIQEETL